MGRLLAIDYGRKRCGIAVTDTLRIVASALETVPTAQLIDFVKSYCAREQVDMIVVGLPRDMHGDPSESMNYIRPGIGRLARAMPGMPIEFFDERFTSVLAHRTMLDSGLGRMKRGANTQIWYYRYISTVIPCSARNRRRWPLTIMN